MTREIGYRRLRAPAEDFGTLIDPPRACVSSLLEQPAAVPVEFASDVAETRQQFIAAARNYTQQYRDLPPTLGGEKIFIAGHQPQLFHAGVWYKNFLLADLAKEHDGVAVNLIIDSDAMRSASIAVPTGTAKDPRIESAAFDLSHGEVPYEEHTIRDRGLFESFGDRAETLIESLVPHPLLHTYWPMVVERSREESNAGLAISQARHRLEGEWGTQSLELPQSWLCELPSFRRFAVHLLREAPRLRDVYNQAADAYRQANRIRSKAHPVPDLATLDEWTETPFWIWTVDQPRRRRLFAKTSGNHLRISDLQQLEFDLATSDAAAVEQLEAFESRGIKLRTRALITTMFARLMLGDLFIHGIGGAKYDEVTDEIVRRFFGVEPPTYLAATATLRLPIDRPGVQEDDLQRVQDQLRDLDFHPERSMDELSSAGQQLLDAKRQWVHTPQASENARQRCHAIRNANQSLQPFVAGVREKLLAEQELTRRLLRVEKLLGSREFAFCLHPAEQLQSLFRTAHT
jgi:hypothetical protein